MIAMLAATLLLPACLAPPMQHDSFWIDLTWSEQFTAAVADGNLYPRWLVSSFGGLGAPVFYFYAPLSFYMTAAFGMFGLPAYPALLAAFWAAWFASGVSMLVWLRGRSACPLAGALLYMVLPYHVIDFYGRGALAEFCAFALVPLIGCGIERAVAARRGLPLALAYAALIMTHLPTATIVSALLIGPRALWLARREPALLWPVARGVAGGIGGGAIYLLPALTLQSHAALGSLWSVQFLQPISWSLLHPALWTSVSYVLLFAGLALGTALAALVVARGRLDYWLIWTIMVCAAVAGLIPFLWSLPTLRAVQFPWRALVVAEFGLATLVARTTAGPLRITVAVLPLVSFAWLMLSADNPLHGEKIAPLPIAGRQDVIEYLPPSLVGAARIPNLDRILAVAAARDAHPGSRFAFPSLQAQCAGVARDVQAVTSDGAVVAPPAGCRMMVRRLPAEWLGLVISLVTWTIFAIPALRSLSRRQSKPDA